MLDKVSCGGMQGTSSKDSYAIGFWQKRTPQKKGLGKLEPMWSPHNLVKSCHTKTIFSPEGSLIRKVLFHWFLKGIPCRKVSGGLAARRLSSYILPRFIRLEAVKLMLFLNLPVAPVNDVHLAAFQLGERIGKCIMDVWIRAILRRRWYCKASSYGSNCLLKKEIILWELTVLELNNWARQEVENGSGHARAPPRKNL